MARRINEKSRLSRAVVFGALQVYDFDPITVGANQANTVVQTFAPLPFACKIPLITIVGNAAIAGLTAFNVVLGSAAEAGALVADTADVGTVTLNTTAGLSLFQNVGNTAPADKAVTLVPWVPQTFPTSEPDAVFPQNTILTVRIVSGAGGAGGVKLMAGLVSADIYPNRPDHTVFSWATDIG